MAITGLGAVSAAGVGVAPLWDSLLHARSGIRAITRFNTEGLASRIAGEVRNFEGRQLIAPRLKPARMSRQAQFAVVAAQEAWRDAGLEGGAPPSRRVGVVIGSSTCAVDVVTESALKMQAKGVEHGNPVGVVMANLHASALAVAELLELDRAYSLGISTACAAGVDAIKAGCDLIKSNHFDTVICGGTDAPLSLTPWAEFTILGLNSTRNDEPGRAVRPFDREREMGLLGEGCGVVVLENLETALDRGAKPYAIIAGDYSCVDPDPQLSGSGFAPAMRGALNNAAREPRDIDFISAWGCGHPELDHVETMAIKEVFGAHAYNLAVSSIKGVIGSPLAAAGALQLIAMALTYRHGILPPTANCEHSDIDCDLDYIVGESRSAAVRHSVLNSHGLGGGNTSLVVGRAV